MLKKTNYLGGYNPSVFLKIPLNNLTNYFYGSPLPATETNRHH